MTHAVDLSRVGIVLCQPQIPENIGGTARAMANMGFGRLSVVNPKSLDMRKIMPLATAGGRHLIESMAVFDTLEEALAEYSYVVGATARMGSHRKAFSPEKLGLELIPISAENEIALLFGPEDRGLTNDDLRYCHHLVNIRTADFASLNLAQAVLIICYEVTKAGMAKPPKFTPRLANRFDLDAMYGQLTDVLTRIGFVNPENPDHWMDNIRRFFSSHPLTARDVKIVRGVCRQMDWYTNRRLKKMEQELKSNK